MSKPILCVDFDGVIHSYISGWRGAAFIPDAPVPGAMQFLIDAIKVFEVHIYSSRSKSEDGRMAMKSWMDYWLDKEFGWDKGLEAVSAANSVRSNIVFANEKPAAFLTIDDRAICFDGDWSELNPEELLKFKPWYRNKTLNKAEK